MENGLIRTHSTQCAPPLKYHTRKLQVTGPSSTEASAMGGDHRKRKRQWLQSQAQGCCEKNQLFKGTTQPLFPTASGSQHLRRGRCRTVRARCGPFPVFPGILPPPLAHARPRSQKSGQNGGSTPTPCLDKVVHAQGGGGTQWRGPQQTTLAGVPKCLWMVTKGLWVISGVSFCLAGLFLLLPGGSNGFHTSNCP